MLNSGSEDFDVNIPQISDNSGNRRGSDSENTPVVRSSRSKLASRVVDSEEEADADVYLNDCRRQ